MIEAMACGTPVIVYPGGAVPEIIEEGHTGFIVEGLEDAVEAARKIPKLSRKRCREIFEQRFTATRMANDYVRAYERLINRKQDEPLEARDNGQGSHSHPRRVLYSFVVTIASMSAPGF